MTECTLTAEQSALYNRALGTLHREHPEGDVVSSGMDCLQRLVAPDRTRADLLQSREGCFLHLDQRPTTGRPVSAEEVPAVLQDLPRTLPVGGAAIPPLLLQRTQTEAALICRTGRGLACFALLRARHFTRQECWMLHLLQPHLELALNRCALYARLPGAEPLTDRQREVLHWMVQGKKDEEIAHILDCSLRTVSNHVHTVLGKLGVENRVSAARCVLCNCPKKGRKGW